MLLLLLLSQHMTVLIIALYILYSHQCKRMQKYEGTWQGPTAIEDTALRWWRCNNGSQSRGMGWWDIVQWKGLCEGYSKSHGLSFFRVRASQTGHPQCVTSSKYHIKIYQVHLFHYISNGWFPHCIRHHPHMVRPSYKTFTTLPACSTTWQTAWRWKKWLCSRHMLVILAVVSTWIHKDSEYFKVNQFEQYLI